jgi:hypothetical protein
VCRLIRLHRAILHKKSTFDSYDGEEFLVREVAEVGASDVLQNAGLADYRKMSKVQKPPSDLVRYTPESQKLPSSGMWRRVAFIRVEFLRNLSPPSSA